MSFFGELVDSFLNWLKSLFWQQEMELTLVGLQNSGKTTLVNVIAVPPSSFHLSLSYTSSSRLHSASF